MDFYNVYNSKYIEVAMRATIYPMYKVELLDQNENVIREITEHISSSNQGSISVNFQQGVRRSCKITINDPDGDFLPNPNTGFLWLNTKFKLYVGLRDIYEDNIYWFSQGVFYVSNPFVSRTEKTVTINGVDKFGIFGSELNYNQLEGTYKIPSGTNAYNAVKDILMTDMGNGYVFDPIQPILDPMFKDYLLPYDIQKAPNSYMSEILIEIANVLGCKIFYDTNGRLNITRGTYDNTYSSDASIWDYTDVLPEYSDSNMDYNFTNAINIVKVVGNNVNSGIYTYTAKNENPLSPVRVGFMPNKMKYVESANIFSTKNAKDYAELILTQESIVTLSLAFNSSCIPHLDADKVITISDKYYDYIQQRFIVQSLEIPLFLGNTSVKACNVTSLPYYEHTSA